MYTSTTTFSCRASEMSRSVLSFSKICRSYRSRYPAPLGGISLDLDIFFKSLCVFLASMLVMISQVNAQDELSNVNSKDTEFSPSLSAEGNYLVFQSNKDASDLNEEAEWKLYNSFKRPDKTWSEPVELENINSNVAFVAGPNLSYDGNTLYFTAFIEGKSESEDIFYSKRIGETWSAPKNIGSPINTSERFEGFPSVSSDENAIYFIRVNEENPWNRKHREDCFTIFVSHKGKNGEWQEPKALPAPINMGCERSPRILADNKTLIFSSIRDEGKGSFDLYQSTMINENEWSEPVALDFMNTKESDLSPSIPASGDVVYYNASGDIIKSVVPENLRQAVNLTVNGSLTNKITQSGLKGLIEVYDKETQNLISSHNTNEANGKYSLVLQSGNNYQLVFKSEGYNPHQVNYDLRGVKEYEERQLNVEMEQFYYLNLAIKDAELASTFPATLVLWDVENKEEKRVIEAKDNKASVKIPTGLNYSIITKAKNYHNDTLQVDLTGDLELLPEHRTIMLKPKKVAVSISLTNMNGGSSRKIRVKNERTGEIIEADASEMLLLRSGDRYKVIVNSEKGYAFASDEIDLTNYEETKEDSASKQGPVIALEIPMIALTVGTRITMEQILFATNSAELDKSSFAELNQLVDMLANNADLRIEIAAYTDDVGSESTNLTLSQQRAQSVANYLFTHGVARNRYIVKGYGERNPRVPNDSPENRAKNRRVEFMVTQ